MAYSKENMITSLTNIGGLVGANYTEVFNGIKGLGMSFERSKFNEAVKAVHDGLFKVAVMSTFAGGRTTVINATAG